MADLSAPEIRSTQFRTAIRGLDRLEVEAFLGRVADLVDELEAQQRKLIAQLDESTARDLETEFDSVGREVTRILQAAREAADAMRERASADSARWRSESIAEAEERRKEASADSEALRRDAWVTGTELLEQAQAEAKTARDQAERDVLTVMGEAEREAHRLTSTARREAEDLVRGATMDAEKITSEAAKRRDDMIDTANRQAGAAQERTRALEQRRDELLEELENVRSTLTRLEGSLEEKRETLDLTTSPQQGTSVRVVPSQPIEMDDWEPGETVRIVSAADDASAESPAEEESETTQNIDEAAPAEPEPLPTPQPAAVEEESDPEVATPEPEPTVPEPTVPEPVAVEDPQVASSGGDDLNALFASLRGGGSASDEATVESGSVAAVGESSESTVTEPVPHMPSDSLEDRDAKLLPIANRALRGIKKAMTELQNIALDSLRTDEAWRPDEAGIADALKADLIGLWTEAFAAGHSAAEEMTGAHIKRPATPPTTASEDFAAAIGVAVSTAIDKAGEGQRARQSAASKVFRVWRTDEAERRIRELAIEGYEQGLEASIHANV